MNNMQIYEAGRAVPPEAQKEFNNGSFSGTDINPMWRIKKLTELFGACGIGWYYVVLSERSEAYGDQVMAIVDLNLYIKVDGEWSKPIYGTGGNSLMKSTRNGTRTSDEGYKMALTDALSVACKALGIGADIYFAKDRTKYTDKYTDAAQEATETPKSTALEERYVTKLKTAAEAAGVQEDVICSWYGVRKVEEMTFEQYRNAAAAVEAKKTLKSTTLEKKDVTALKTAAEAAGVSEDVLCSRYGVRKVEELTFEQYIRAVAAVEATAKARKKVAE